VPGINFDRSARRRLQGRPDAGLGVGRARNQSGRPDACRTQAATLTLKSGQSGRSGDPRTRNPDFLECRLEPAVLDVASPTANEGFDSSPRVGFNEGENQPPGAPASRFKPPCGCFLPFRWFLGIRARGDDVRIFVLRPRDPSLVQLWPSSTPSSSCLSWLL